MPFRRYVVLDYSLIFGDFSNFRKCSDPQLSEDLMKFESSQIIRHYKFGVLYCADGQTTEAEMFENGKSPIFGDNVKFLEATISKSF